MSAFNEPGRQDTGTPVAAVPPPEHSWQHRVGQHLRRRLLAGLFVIFPVSFTVWVIYVLFRVLDGFLSPILDPWIGFHIPGLGLLGVVLLLYLVGLLAANVVGREFIRGFDSLLKRMPVVRAIYVASKQLMDTLRLPGKTAFQRVVLIEYPRREIWALAFVTSSARRESDQEPLVHLFLPTSPNPTSGMMLIVPETEVKELDMSVEDGVRLVVSGGILSPDSYSLPARKLPPGT